MRNIDVRVDALHRCIKKLPNNDAMIINMRYGQEATVKTMSDRWDAPKRPSIKRWAVFTMPFCIVFKNT